MTLLSSNLNRKRERTIRTKGASEDRSKEARHKVRTSLRKAHALNADRLDILPESARMLRPEQTPVPKAETRVVEVAAASAEVKVKANAEAVVTEVNKTHKVVAEEVKATVNRNQKVEAIAEL